MFTIKAYMKWFSPFLRVLVRPRIKGRVAVAYSNNYRAVAIFYNCSKVHEKNDDGGIVQGLILLLGI